MFEEEWQVLVFDDVLEVKNPKHGDQRIHLRDIKEIAIQTNDSGPFDSDVIWLVSDGTSVISFPMGAKGESDVLAWFQKFEGFDNEQFISAMGSTENNIFILWKSIKA